MAHLLLLEDHPYQATQLKNLLEQRHHQVRHTDTIRRAIELTQTYRFDLCVVDRMVTDGDGLNFVSYVHEVAETLPCLVLSEKGSSSERVAGLQQGARDYMAKPFSGAEFLLRVSNLLLLTGANQDQLLTYGALHYSQNTGQVRVHDSAITLRRREAQLLGLLLRAQGRVLSKEYIIQQLWQNLSDQPQTETIDVYIRRLRSRLPYPHRDLIETVRGFGYRLKKLS